MTNIKKLRALMVEYGDTPTSLAEYLEISRLSLYNKLRHPEKYFFKIPEIGKIIWRYNMSAELAYEVFLKRAREVEADGTKPDCSASGETIGSQ